MTWQHQALCAEVDPDLWFPNKGESNPQARAICRQCPVQFQCLQAGQGEEYGIWGGLTRNQRRKGRRQERAA